MRNHRRTFHYVWGGLLLVGTLLLVPGLLAPGADGVVLAGPGPSPVDDNDFDGIPNVSDNDFYGADPDDPDTDGDGFDDGFELATGSDPYDYAARPVAASGTAILVGTRGSDVYISFVRASSTQFAFSGGEKILFAAHSRNSTVFASIDVTEAFKKRVVVTTSQDGQVTAWTVKVGRNQVALWSLGFGFRDLGQRYCDGVLVHRRADGLIYTVSFDRNDQFVKSELERREPDPGSSSRPGSSGFKECEQISFSASKTSPVRHILKESCETRDTYICPVDCGVLAGLAVLNMKQVWLY